MDVKSSPSVKSPQGRPAATPAQQEKTQSFAEAFQVLGEYFRTLNVDAVDVDRQKWLGDDAPSTAALLRSLSTSRTAGFEPAATKVKKGLGFGDLYSLSDIALYESTRSSINGLLRNKSVKTVLKAVPASAGVKGQRERALRLVLQDALDFGVGVTAGLKEKRSGLSGTDCDLSMDLRLSGAESQLIQEYRVHYFDNGCPYVEDIYKRGEKECVD
jgi:hypothetical protein